MNKISNNWKLRTKWILTYSIMVLLVSGTMAIGLYWQLRAAQHQALRERLHDIVSFAAPLVDGDFHSLIRSPEDEAGSFYRVVSLRLKSIQDTSDIIKRIYTLRQQEDGRIIFVVDVDPVTHANMGQEYLRVSPLLEKGLTSIPGPVVEDSIYKDSSGTYLSGYAPIYDQFRDLDGVLGIDIDATTVIASEDQARRTIFMAFLATAPVSLLLGWWLALYLTSPINDLMRGAERVAQGHLDETVPVRSGDELGVLAKTFNKMTTQLRQTLRGLEREITEHQRAEKVQRVIYRISQAAISSNDFDELYHSIHNILGELISVENFYIALYDSASDLISFPYYRDQYDEQPPPVKLGRGLTDYVLRTGQPLLATPEIFAELVQRGEVELTGTKSVDWLGVPLRVDGKIIGVIAAQSYSEEIRFNQENLYLFEFISAQAALAIERKRTEEALHKNNERYRALFEDSPISLWEEDFSGVKHILESLRQEGVTDFQSYLESRPDVVAECAAQVKILDVNKATLVLFGAKTKEDVLNNLAFVLDDEPCTAFQDELVKIAEGLTEFKLELVNQTLSGKLIEVSISWSVVPGYERDLSKVIISMIDITDRKRAERELKERKLYLETLLEAVPDAIVTMNAHHRVMEWNSAAERLFQYTQEEAIGQDLDDLITVPSIREEAAGFTQIVISGGSVSPTETIRYRKDASPVNVLLAASSIMMGGELHGVVGVYTDTTKLKQAEAALQKLAITDPLVGCFNRRHFFSLAERELARVVRYKHHLSIIMVDIDHFKQVNDTYGHSVGDQVLIAIARRIEDLLRSTDIFARYGGEEFVILLPESSAIQAKQTAERLREKTEEPFSINELEISVSISLGVSCRSGEDDIGIDALLDKADQALYAAKRTGRNRVMTWPVAR